MSYSVRVNPKEKLWCPVCEKEMDWGGYGALVYSGEGWVVKLRCGHDVNEETYCVDRPIQVDENTQGHD